MPWITILISDNVPFSFSSWGFESFFLSLLYLCHWTCLLNAGKNRSTETYGPCDIECYSKNAWRFHRLRSRSAFFRKKVLSSLYRCSKVDSKKHVNAFLQMLYQGRPKYFLFKLLGWLHNVCLSFLGNDFFYCPTLVLLSFNWHFVCCELNFQGKDWNGCSSF